MLVQQGAALLFSSSLPVVRHVIDAAFDRQGHGKQLVRMQILSPCFLYSFCCSNICWLVFSAIFLCCLSHMDLFLGMKDSKISRLWSFMEMHASL